MLVSDCSSAAVRGACFSTRAAAAVLCLPVDFSRHKRICGDRQCRVYFNTNHTSIESSTALAPGHTGNTQCSTCSTSQPAVLHSIQSKALHMHVYAPGAKISSASIKCSG
jgi:hypothetical protein